MSDLDEKVYVSPTGERIPRVWGNFKNGKIPFTELDDEELGRAQLRDKNGGFSGMPPRMIPRDMLGDVKRRLLERYNENIQQRLIELQRVFLDIAQDDTASPADRMKAATYMTERLIGKVPEKIEIQAEIKPWEGMVSGILEEAGDDAV